MRVELLMVIGAWVEAGSGDGEEREVEEDGGGCG